MNVNLAKHRQTAEMPIAVAQRWLPVALCTSAWPCEIHGDVVGLASYQGPDVGCKASILIGQC
jgi:hypothetical protein